MDFKYIISQFLGIQDVIIEDIKLFRKDLRAVIEELNNKIKVLKRMGYGYSNPLSFMRKILQRCGYLNHLSINTDEFYYRMPNP